MIQELLEISWWTLALCRYLEKVKHTNQPPRLQSLQLVYPLCSFMNSIFCCCCLLFWWCLFVLLLFLVVFFIIFVCFTFCTCFVVGTGSLALEIFTGFFCKTDIVGKSQLSISTVHHMQNVATGLIQVVQGFLRFSIWINLFEISFLSPQCHKLKWCKCKISVVN